jgi:hypothetical protein
LRGVHVIGLDGNRPADHISILKTMAAGIVVEKRSVRH